jgi:murein DD-endopeptidase MepM/ murein hydrolase activator NlpD
MNDQTSESLIYPVDPYKVRGYTFAEKVRQKVFFWSTHLGEDVEAEPGVVVSCIGGGEVVWSEMRKGSSEKSNWGGIVVIRHQNNWQSPVFNFQNFYSVYGHMKDLEVNAGDRVGRGQRLGVVAEGLTPENGWWKIPHLHFAIYVGPWDDKIVPGFKRLGEWRTKVKWWRCPSKFIEEYNEQKSK